MGKPAQFAPVHFGSFGWALDWGDVIFLVFLVRSVDLDKLCSWSFFHHFMFYSFMFMHKISARVACFNGKHPRNKNTVLPQR